MRIKELKAIQLSLESMRDGKPMHEMQPYYLKALLDAVVIIAEDVANERGTVNARPGSETAGVPKAKR